MNINKILDRHPEVKKAIEWLGSKPHSLTGFYWREKVVETLATQYHADGPNKGKITYAAMDWAEMMMEEYDKDNG
jgi:hypothetical protein